MPADIRGSDMRPDDGAYDKSNVVSKVAETLQTFGGGQDDKLEGLETFSTPEKKEEQAEEEKSTPGQDEQAEESESSPESSEQKAESDKSKTAIPDNYYRALVHQEWTPEEIATEWEKDPDRLIKWGEKAYKSMNDLSQQFSSLGRAKIELEKRQVALGKSQQSQQSQQSQASQQPPVDMEKLRQKYEDDPFGATVDLLKAFSQPQASAPIQPVSEPAVSENQLKEDLALIQHVVGFLGADDMKPYNDFYGPVCDENGMLYFDIYGEHLSPGQAANRFRVLQEADRIIAGAAFQGHDMPIQQAMAMAHIIVTAPITKKILRDELVAQVKKKAKGVTLRPNSRKASVPQKDGQPKSEAQLEKDTEARIQRIKEGKPLK